MDFDLSCDRDAFNAFLDQRFIAAHGDATLEDAVAAFRAYQRDLEQVRKKLQPSIEQADRGEGRPLDLDAVMQRVRDRISANRAN
jgi:hypothetical protein